MSDASRSLDRDPTAVPPPAVPEAGVAGASERPAIQRAVRRYVRGLAEEDLPTATDAAVTLEDLSAPVGEVLTGLADAVESDRVLEARALRWRLRERYRRRRPFERARFERTLLARRFDLADHPSMDRFRAADARIGPERSAFLTDALALFGGVSLSRERRRDLRNAAAQLAASEVTYHDLGASAMAAVEGADLPAAVSILAARPADDRVRVGEETALELVIGNVGDGESTGVTASVEGDLGIDDPTVEFGSLGGPGFDTATVRVDAATLADTYEFTVDLGSDQAGGDDTVVELTATDAPLSVAAAYDEDGSGRLTTTEVQRAVADYNRDDPVPGFDEGPPTAEELRRLLVLWAHDQPV